MEKQAVIYTRQSFGSEQGAVSTALQEASCRERCKQMGLTVAAVYTDSNTSSELYPDTADGRAAASLDKGFLAWQKAQKSEGRKAYKKGLGDAFSRIEAGGISYLVVDEGTRLGRNADFSNLSNFLHYFLLSHGVQLIEAKTGGTVDFSNDMGRLVEMIRSQIEYDSLKHKRENSLRALAKRREDGLTWSSATGVRTEGGKVVFDDAWRPVIAEAFTKVAKGETIGNVQRWLNATKRTGAKQWYYQKVRLMLSCGTYAGLMRGTDGNWQEAKNIVDPVITAGLFFSVQSVLEGKKALGHKAGAKAGGAPLPFSGLIRCGHCGLRMRYWENRSGKIYLCKNDGSHSMSIRIDEIERALLPLCILRLNSALREMAKMSDDTLAKKGMEISRLKAALKAKMRMISTDDDYELFRDEIDATKAQIKALEREIVEAKANSGSEAKEQYEAAFRALSKGEALDDASRVRIVRDTYKEIVVHSDSIKVTLWDGNQFTLPRIREKHGRMALPVPRFIRVDQWDGKEMVAVAYDADLPWGYGDRTICRGDYYAIGLV